MRSLMRTDKNHQMKSKSISQNTFVYQIGKKKLTKYIIHTLESRFRIETFVVMLIFI